MITFLVYPENRLTPDEMILPPSAWEAKDEKTFSAYAVFMQVCIKERLLTNASYVVTAQDEGVDFIRDRISGIPFSTFRKDNAVWRDELALFIMENLSFPFMNHFLREDVELPHNQVFELDDEPGVWLFQTTEIEETFNDEDAACKRQREWRKEHGLHPINGTWY